MAAVYIAAADEEPANIMIILHNEANLIWDVVKSIFPGNIYQLTSNISLMIGPRTSDPLANVL